MVERNNRLFELDCLRGIAAISVTLFHYALNNGTLDYGLKFGATAVELFFMISGFVIYLTIEKNDDYKKFIIARFARLFPSYWVCVTITAAAIVLYHFLIKQPSTLPSFQDYLINLTMLEDFLNTPSIEASYWSLAIELMFYALILILYLTKLLNRIEFISYIILLISLINRFLPSDFPGKISNVHTESFAIVYYIPLFLAGIMFYKIKFQGVSLNKVVIIVMCYLTQVALWEPIGGHALETHFQYGIIILLYFFLFVLFTLDKLKLIVNKPLIFLGKISYPLYLVHNYLGSQILIPTLVHSKRFGFNIFVAIIITICIVIIIATLITKLIEIPANKSIKKYLYAKIVKLNFKSSINTGKHF